MKTTLKRVISGGQTGADIGGLLAATKLGIETGGWICKDYLTEDGPNFELKKYGLKCLDSTYYPERTKKNIDDSDGTIVFRLKYSPGSDYTIGYAQNKIWQKGILKTVNKDKTLYKPVCVITDLNDHKKIIDIIVNFIKENNIEIVNIAGHRESTAPIKNFTQIIENILVEAFSKCTKY